MADQRRPLVPLVLLVLGLSPWPSAHAAKKHFSHRGALCTDSCVPRGFPQTYKCTVHTADDSSELQYCSPMMNVDTGGNKCTDCCETHGYGYYWCYTGSQWGYCGYVLEDSKHYTSTYDALCYDSCDKRGEDYYWCQTTQGWDYCSPRNDVDRKGRACAIDHPCDKHGESYLWCRLEGGSWDQCGRVEPRAMIHQTKDLHQCIDDCQYHESKGYFWCHTQDDWDYCSPVPDVTYRDEPCRSDHKCGSHGEKYNWCYTSDSWDYCGTITPGECTYSQPHRRKRDPDPPQVICTKTDNNNRRVTTFTAVVNTNAITQASDRERADALNFINQWDNRGLGDRARSEIFTSRRVRIDNQGSFPRNNVRYCNLQIQQNRPRGSGESTTIAHVEVPMDTPAEYVRLAFRESLQRRARVTLTVTVQQSTSNNNNNNNKKCRRPR